MPLTIAVAEPHLHRFGSQTPTAVTAVVTCVMGHGHEQRRALYRCTRPDCVFALTMPLEQVEA